MCNIVFGFRNFYLLFILCFLNVPMFSESYYAIIDGEPVEVMQMRVESLMSHAPDENFLSNGTKSNHEFVQNDGTLMQHSDAAGRTENWLRKLRKECVKCPIEVEAVAPRGYDGIFVEPPAALACRTSLPYSTDLFRIETLFGPELNFVLPEGHHKFIGKIRNVENGRIVRSCLLKYHVHVRRCPNLPRYNGRKLKMSCSAGTIWGSKCAFECRTDGTHLSHNEPMICNADLQWDGSVPECRQDIELCEWPNAPANGQYSCKDSNGENDSELLAPGSLCHVNCDPTYFTPSPLFPYSIIQCESGVWNITDIDVCYKEEPHRRSMSRRHQTRHAPTP